MARSESSKLKRTVQKVLTKPEIRWVNIEYVISPALTVSLNALSYFAVAVALEKKRVTCVVDSSLPENVASYDSVTNELAASSDGYGSSNSTDYRLERALLVHEATHIVLDMYKGRRVPILHEETIAYLAQALFSRATKAPAIGGALGEARKVIANKAKDVSPTQLNSGCYRFRFNASDTDLRALHGKVRVQYNGATGHYVASGISGGMKELLQ